MRKSAFLYLLILGCAPSSRYEALSGGPGRNARVDELYDQGLKCEAQGHWVDAEKLFTQVLQEAPGHTGAWCHRGNVKMNTDDIRGALLDYNAALKTDARYVEAHFRRGLVKILVHDYRGAIDDLTSAIRLDPKHVDSYRARLSARLRLGDYLGIAEDSSGIIRMEPNDTGAYAWRAIARAKLGDPVRAIKDFDQYLTLVPNDAEAYMQRALAKVRVGDSEGALVDASEALRLNDPRHMAMSYAARSLALEGIAQKKPEEAPALLRVAEEDLRHALDLLPKSSMFREDVSMWLKHVEYLRSNQ